MPHPDPSSTPSPGRGRYNRAKPPRRPANTNRRGVCWPGLAAMNTDHTASATPPFQASAVRPMGGYHDDQGCEGTDRRRPASPVSSHRPHSENDPHVLEQAEPPLGGKEVPKTLNVPASTHRLPGRVQVQEVGVGYRSAQHLLGEGQHEALLHRRPLVAQETTQRQSEAHQHDQDGNHVERVRSPSADRRGVPIFAPRPGSVSGRHHSTQPR
jgi:hypothetical protein